MAVISFKSVGKTAETRESEKQTPSTIPIGIKTPMQEGRSGDGVWAMHFDVASQVHDNLRNLIQTNHGERLGLFDFGANLRDLTTELVSQEDFDGEAIVRIKEAVSKWMPYVTLKDYISAPQHEENQKIGIVNFTVTYDIPALNVENRAMLVTLYVI